MTKPTDETILASIHVCRTGCSPPFPFCFGGFAGSVPSHNKKDKNKTRICPNKPVSIFDLPPQTSPHPLTSFPPPPPPPPPPRLARLFLFQASKARRLDEESITSRARHSVAERPKSQPEGERASARRRASGRWSPCGEGEDSFSGAARKWKSPSFFFARAMEAEKLLRWSEMVVGQSKPPGIGPQVLVLGSVSEDPFWVPIFDPRPCL